MTVRTSLSLALALPSLLGCGGERWVIGESAGAGVDATVPIDAGYTLLCTSGTSAALPRLSAPPELAEVHLGTWRAPLLGAEAEAFPAGQLQLQVARSLATLRFDGGSSVPPLLDPTAGYLCNSSMESCASPAGFVAGFDYMLVDARSRGSILSFGLLLDEPWDEWCRLQTPVEYTQPGCEPHYAVELPYEEARRDSTCAVRRADVWTDIPCDRLATVERQVCACTVDGCRVGARQLTVNLRSISPDSLEGALWFTSERALGLLFSRGE